MTSLFGVEWFSFRSICLERKLISGLLWEPLGYRLADSQRTSRTLWREWKQSLWRCKYLLWQSFELITLHYCRNSSLRNVNSVIIYLPSCCLKLVWIIFFCKTKVSFEKMDQSRLWINHSNLDQAINWQHPNINNHHQIIMYQCTNISKAGNQDNILIWFLINTWFGTQIIWKNG